MLPPWKVNFYRTFYWSFLLEASKLKKKAARGNIKSSPDLDKKLLRHLFSPNRFQGVASLGFTNKEEQLKAKNRLAYLKRIRSESFEDFVDICIANEVYHPSLEKELEEEDDELRIEELEEAIQIEAKRESSAATPIKHKQMQANVNNIRGQKYLAAYPDGRYLGVYKLLSGFDETRQKFRVSECKTKIVLRTKKPNNNSTVVPVMECAKKIFSKHGFSTDSVHNVALQAQIDATIKSSFPNGDHFDEVIFDIGEEVKPKFMDCDAHFTNTILIESHSDGSEWAYFWVIGKDVKVEDLVDACIQRNRKRLQSDVELQEITREFNNRMDRAAEEKQKLEAQLLDMRRQLASLMVSQQQQPNYVSSQDATLAEQLANDGVNHMNVDRDL